MPIRKHITRFSSNIGIEPQIEVAMNIRPASRIDARRPIRSPSHPHVNEPTTMPTSATSGKIATGTSPSGYSSDFRPYSSAMPGTTNASVVGFITSIVTAAAITRSSRTCASRSGASSSVWTRRLAAASARRRAERAGTSP